MVIEYLENNTISQKCILSNIKLTKFEIINNKMIYDFTNCRKKDAQIKLHQHRFNNGANRNAFFCIFISDSEKLQILKKKIREKNDIDSIAPDLKCRLIGAELAEIFNKILNKNSITTNIEIIKNKICQLSNSKEFFTIEEFLKGDYEKFSNNYEFYSKKNTIYNNLAQCFSHWTFDYSGSKLLINDIQGVETKYTDIQVITSDGDANEFGLGNMGRNSMLSFLLGHECNDFCKKLGLNDLKVVSQKLKLGL